MWLADIFVGDRDQDVRLFNPYFTSADDRMKQHAVLIERQRTLGPEHDEKLRQARLKHKAEKRGH